jgi:RNA polymerase sigma-70 factor, ECF subfamily
VYTWPFTRNPKNKPEGRRSSGSTNDDRDVSNHQAASEDLAPEFLAFYDDALAHVYGYISARCGRRSTAEDLTSETFLAAVDAVRRDNPPPMSLPWIIGVARHKLVDHWRRLTRETSGLRALADEPDADREDQSDAQLDALQARETLAKLAPHHQAVLTLRYLDDLPVPEVAALLGRTVHATESHLVRARKAFRRAYDDQIAGDEETLDG